jgi:hypothetical protein
MNSHRLGSASPDHFNGKLCYVIDKLKLDYWLEDLSKHAKNSRL